MNKVTLVLIVLGLLLVMPLVAAAGEHSDNSIAIVFHWISMVFIVVVVVFTLMAANMFAEDLGRAMKFIGAGMILIGVNSVMEELTHLEIFIIPEGTLHSLTYHGLSGIGYVIIAYGFYRVYTVAKGVSSKKK